MSLVIFCATWVAVFSLMENYFMIESKAAYAVVGFLFSFYSMVLNYFFEKHY